MSNAVHIDIEKVLLHLDDGQLKEIQHRFVVKNKDHEVVLAEQLSLREALTIVQDGVFPLLEKASVRKQSYSFSELAQMQKGCYVCGCWLPLSN